MTNDLDAQVRLADIRSRVTRGEFVRPEEYRDLITNIRRGYAAAAKSSSAARKRPAKAAAPDFTLDTVFPAQ
jgi:hypothetical protein